MQYEPTNVYPEIIRRFLEGESVEEGATEAGLIARGGLLDAYKPVRVALVGCGRHSRAALQPNLARLSCYDYVAACDLNEDLARDSARRFGATAAYTDYRRMLRECAPEAVIVVGAPKMHAEVARECLQQGAHVFVEKPPAPTVREAQELATLAEETSRHTMVGTMSRHCRAFRSARSVLDAAETAGAAFFVATGYMPGPRSVGTYGLGSIERTFLIAQAIHVVDAVRFLVGEIREVNARVGRNEDGALAYAVAVRCENGACGTIGLTSFAQALELYVSVHAWSGQYIEIRNNRHLRVVGPPTLPGARGHYADVNAVEWDQGYSYGGTLRQGYLEELQAFAVGIRSGVAVGPSFRDAVETLKVCEAIVQSGEDERLAEVL